MNDFKIKWFKKTSLKNGILIKGVPGVGNISHISVDYLVNKLNAELICRIYSNYLPNIVLVREDSTVEEPNYEIYLVTKNKKKIILLKNNYPPTKEYYSYLTNEYLADFFKKQGLREVITIAGIAYKEVPKSTKLYGATTNTIIQKKLKKTELIFDGNKSVGLIIGSAGLLLTRCASKGIPGFCILVSTWGHPNYIGIKESKKTIKFLSEYLGFSVDFTDLNKEIRRINKEAKKVRFTKKQLEKTEYNKSRYIG